MSEPQPLPPGTAAVKREFLIAKDEPIAAEAEPDDDALEAAPLVDRDGPPPAKKQKLSGAQKKKLAREEAAKKKQNKGMNTNRKFARVHDATDVCWRIAMGNPCDAGEKCKFSHDLAAYLATKPPDIAFPSPTALSSIPPFVSAPDPPVIICPNFDERGECTQGFKCRFLSGHMSEDRQLLSNDEKVAKSKNEVSEGNVVLMDQIKRIRTRMYPTPITDAYLTELSRIQDDEGDNEADKPSELANLAQRANSESVVQTSGFVPPNEMSAADSSTDVPFRAVEKTRLKWTGLTYLAPLTTVGNLPFRRLCVDFGADITCGEMALATSLLSGNKEEWSLIRKHPSERTYGVQLAGNKPASLGRISEILAQELGTTGLDFVDVNCGCPIDMVFKSGAGSALLDTPGRLGKIIKGMDRALGEIPVTIKIRTGVKDGKNTAHRLMERLDGWGVGAVTIHGRTRQQRYTKLADWNYIKQCVDVLRRSTNDEDDDACTIPIFGGGDVYTAAGYWETLESSGVDGIMIGRGALIKPWILRVALSQETLNAHMTLSLVPYSTEIKERREWDISSRERLDIIRKYAEYGLNHWGSDTQGVNATRRYLCEALSFQHRYIPLGILETHSRPKLNDRAPSFKGRDELETLLSSTKSEDWVRISELFLGKAPEGWHFTPKHKSNAASDEGNG